MVISDLKCIMKVICAGTIKTGTKSLHAALEELGYEVYDFPDHFYYLNKEWGKVMEGNATTNDFYEMYKDVDVGIDLPFFYFWREIADAFPDAKIIFTVRDSEENWVESVKRQADVANVAWWLKLMFYLSPYGRKWLKAGHIGNRVMFGERPLFSSGPFNRLLYLQHYRRHNAYVLQHAPKDRLLIFNVKQGWDPLCKFLDKPVPTKCFPHLNIKGQLFDIDFLVNSPAMLKLKKETIKSVVVLSSVLVAGISTLIYRWFKMA